MIKQFTTSVVVINELSENAEVLLIHHKKFNKWMIPGGHIEEKENPIEAAIREVKEETGVDIDLISFIHKKLAVADGMWMLPPEYLYQQVIPPRASEAQHFHVDFTYVAIARKYSELTVNLSETNALKWVAVSEVDDLNMFDGTRIIIKDIQHKILHKKEYFYEIQ